MNADEFARSKQILLRAADLPEAEREAYLDASCPDPELSQKAEAMLGRLHAYRIQFAHAIFIADHNRHTSINEGP